MHLSFKNQVALVTGAASGIGLVTAKAFAEAGAAVTLADINEDGARSAAEALVAAGHRAIGVRCDVAEADEVAAMVGQTVSTFGRLDAAFNNAGIQSPLAETADSSAGDFDRVTAVNLRGIWSCMKYESLQMREQGSGAIVNCSSIGGLVGIAGRGVYHASKHGVLGLTKAAAADVARLGIRINAICPGPVETRMMRSLEAQRNPTDPEAIAAANRAGIPTGRYTTPEEVANTVLYLCSSLSGNVTGTHIMLDGGRSGSGGAPSPSSR
jgi:NAD(P)-dependent dehydrogenase (short-subunit alcohol dehydrogenase family)